MPIVAPPNGSLGITDIIGHQEEGCKYRVETINNGNMHGERA